jgi:hypothetical protein
MSDPAVCDYSSGIDLLSRETGLVVKWWPGFSPNHSLLRLSQVSKFAVDPLARTLPDKSLGFFLIEEAFNPLGPAIRSDNFDDPAEAVCALLRVERGSVF